MVSGAYLCKVKNASHTFPAIGILGGGQLGRMLIQAGINYNLEIHTLDPDGHAPASGLSHSFTCGSFQDYQTVIDFGMTCDLITVEIEHVNIQALKTLEKSGKRVFPQTHILEMIQDKGTQKQYFIEHQIPTAEYLLIEKRSDLVSVPDDFFPCFQKLRTSGYDGKGVQYLRSKSDIELAFDAASVLEKAIPVEKEISVIVAANGKGEIKAFPPVDMLFHPEANLVEFLSSPSTISEAKQQEATQIAVRIAELAGIRGLLAVEMFLTEQGTILVNELAPRPHNSGHQSIEGNAASQFEQHLRAILGWPLADTTVVSPSVMLNLLGEPGFDGPAYYEGLEEVLRIPGVNIHLYGKKYTRPYRKMGHVTVVAPKLDGAIDKARIVRNTLKVKATS